MRQILAVFADSGIDRERIEAFLAAEPRRGQGSVRDHIAAEMANQLLGALGQSSSQNPQKTKKLRELGAWREYHRRPEE